MKLTQYIEGLPCAYRSVGAFPYLMSWIPSHNSSGERSSLPIFHKMIGSLWEVREVLKVTWLLKRRGFKLRQLIPNQNFLQPTLVLLQGIRHPLMIPSRTPWYQGWRDKLSSRHPFLSNYARGDALYWGRRNGNNSGNELLLSSP